MTKLNIKASGFGGQGIMLLGKILSYAAVEDNKNTVWYPTYGPETRGGTSNCTIIISDDEINSPVVNTFDILLIMNQPSMDKFLPMLKKGGLVIYNSNLVAKPKTTNNAIGVPVNDIAAKLELPQAANIVMLGTFIAKTNLFSKKTIEAIITHILGERKAKFIPINMKAVEEGMEFIKK